MNEKKKLKTVRDILEEKGFNPTEELVDLAIGIKQDYADATTDLKAINDPMLKREILTEVAKIKKTQVDIIKNISDAKQREDDQRLKFEEMQIKKQLAEAKIKESQNDDSNEATATVYYAPSYETQIGADGKKKMIELDGRNVQ